MKSFYLLLLSFTFSLLVSCSSDTEKSATTKESKDTIISKENFEKGQIIEKVSNLNNTNQSFALYLPSSYTHQKPFPAIYIFDPHGDGKLPISNYKNLAEQYGYILIASNDSKNGIQWEEIQRIANNLFTDSQQRLSINASRLYLLGFSGGARIANGLCITNGAFSGVICCGAAAPSINSRSPRNNYTYLGICGNRDFNYIEMRKYNLVDLAGKFIKNSFIEFDGKHEWPNEKVMNDAFLWTELCAMRKEPSLKNEKFIPENLTLFSNQIKQAQEEKNTFEVYKLVMKTITFFDGLADLTEFYNIYNPLKANEEVDKKLKEEERNWSKEEKLKSTYIEAFQSKNSNWWRQEVVSINKKIKSGNQDDKLIYSRILSYLSLLAYMQTTGMLQQQNIPAAKSNCQTYIIIDPTNNEAHYLNATILAIESKKKESFNALNTAIKNGFKDYKRLENDSAFFQYKTTEEFKEIIEKINNSNVTSDTK